MCLAAICPIDLRAIEIQQLYIAKRSGNLQKDDVIRFRLDQKTRTESERQRRIHGSNLKDLTDFLSSGQPPSSEPAVWRNHYAAKFMTGKGLFASHRAAFVRDFDNRCDRCCLNETDFLPTQNTDECTCMQLAYHLRAIWGRCSHARKQLIASFHSAKLTSQEKARNSTD